MLAAWWSGSELLALKRAAGAGGAQAEEEDHAAADGHDPHLAADDRQGQLLLLALGQGFEFELAELALGGAGAGALGEEGDDEGRDPVEVVQIVGWFVAAEDEQAAEQRLQEDGDLGGAQQVPEGDRGAAAQPAGARASPTSPASRLRPRAGSASGSAST